MKLIKKTVSLLLACFMIIGNAGAFAQEQAEETVSALTAEDMLRIGRLKILGLTDSKNADNPENSVTRGELANVAANMIGIGMDYIATDVKTELLDIEESPYCVQIQALTDIGAVSGVNPYQFRPDRAVKYTEALKVILSVLGYGTEAEARNGYPAGYLYLASRLDIDSRRIKNADAITWGELAEIVEACYDVPVQTITGAGKFIEYSQDGETFLSRYHDVVKICGQLKDNGYTTRTTSSGVDTDFAVINNTSLKKGETDIEKALGEYVECYAKDKGGSLTALFYSVKEKYEKVVITAAQIESANVNEIAYTDENGTIRKIKISPYANFVYNDEAYPDFTDADIDISNGRLTLFDDRENESGYDLIIAEEYETMVVAAFDTAKNSITGTLGEYCCTDDYKSSFIYNAQHEEMSFDSVSMGSVASMYKSKGDTVIRIVFTQKDITGEISAISNDDGMCYYIGDTPYLISESLCEKIQNKVIGAISPTLGITYTFNIDTEGNIAGISGGAANKFYAYVTAASNDHSPISKDYTYVRAAVPSVGFISMRTAKKVTVNYQSTKTPGEELADLPALYDEGGSFKPQLVLITVNKAGDIIEFNTATTTLNSYGYNEKEFSLDFTSSAAEYRSGTKSFESYAMHKDAPIFLVPESLNESEFDVFMSDSMPTNNIDYNVELYDLDASHAVSAAIIHTKKAEPVYQSDLLLVEKVKYVRTYDGEFVKQLTGYYGVLYVDYAEAEPGLLDEWIPEGIKPGDLLEISLKSGRSKFNPQDYVVNDTLISAARKVLSCANLPEKAAGKIDFGNGDLYSMAYGPIYSRSDVSTTLITNTAGTEVTKIGIPQAGTLAYYIFNAEDKTIKAGAASDFHSTSTIYEDGSVDIDWSNICIIKKHSGGEKMAIYVKR